MAASKFDVIELQDLQYQLDIVEENVQHLLAIQKKAGDISKKSQKDPLQLSTLYEKHYRTALNLSQQYERKINLLEKLNQKKIRLEMDNGQQHGIKLGLAFGLFVGFATCAPIMYFL